jgi:hypothetical protein
MQGLLCDDAGYSSCYLCFMRMREFAVSECDSACPAARDGLFSSVVVVRDGVLQSDTGESRLAPPPPRPLAPYDAAEQQ